MKSHPNILKSIFISILTLLVFALVYFITFLLLGGIIYLLTKIPLIGTLISWLFSLRGDSPDMVLAILAPAIAYYTSIAVAAKMGKDNPTINLSYILLGIYILVIHVPSLIINLVNGEWFFPNITQSIAGIVLLFNGATSFREAKEDSTR